MNFQEYQDLAARTDNIKTGPDSITNASMGMVGEAAEVLEHIKKCLYQGHKLNIEKIIEETGDVLWYVAKMARTCGVSLEEVASRNIEKLKKRYPKEVFETERSLFRLDEKD